MAFLTDTAAQQMCISAHVASETLTSVKLIFQNFKPANFTGDVGNGSAATITAAIEYNGSIDAQVTFSGATSGTIPNGTTLASDYITLPTPIPSGASYFVRKYQTNPNGVYYNNWAASSLGEACNTAASGLTDQTMNTGSLTGGTAQSSYSAPPMAIVGYTVHPSVLIIGDSKTEGTGDGVSDPACNFCGKIGNVAMSMGNTPFVSIALGSAYAGTWLSWATGRDTLLPYGSQVIMALGINDIDAGTTDALLISYSQAILSAASAPKKYIATVEPHTNSTDGWLTLVNQTNQACYGTPPCPSPDIRVQFNTSIRAGISGITGYYDVASAVESGFNSTLWVVSPSPPYTVDGIHEKPAGYNLIANSGVIVPTSYPFLLNRDLDPASNDNSPAYLAKAA
jgi:lysophospholipase L1-like esterase